MKLMKFIGFKRTGLQILLSMSSGSLEVLQVWEKAWSEMWADYLVCCVQYMVEVGVVRTVMDLLKGYHNGNHNFNICYPQQVFFCFL